jgi:hypothetical protein
MAGAVKPLVLYNQIDVEASPLECIYFIDNECRAQLNTDKAGKCYAPTEEDQTSYCKDEEFPDCPRFIAYQDHLRAIGLQK